MRGTLFPGLDLPLRGQENSGEEKKAEQPAKVASTIYKVGIDGAT